MRNLALASVFALVAFASNLHAGYTYNIKFNPNFAATSIGGTVNVDVILEETTTDLINDPLKLSDPGIGLQGASLQINVSPFVGAGATALTAVDTTSQAAFFDVIAQGTVVNPTTGTIELSAFAPVAGTAVGSTASINLGTLTFTGLHGGIDKLSVIPLTGGGGDIVLGDATSLDSLINFGGISGFVSVPEPSSLLSLSLLGLAGGWYRRRRKLAAT